MDTTISGISSTLMFISKMPDLWRQFREDRTRVKFMFEEALRLESPIQSFFRTTTGETDLGGMRLKGDIKVQVFIGAANRDPRRWPNANEFDINRPATTNLAFGYGIHACIGQLIARMEAEAVLVALLDRCAAIEPRGEPEYRLLNCLRTIDRLPLRLVAA
jgi:cytochrome P450